MIKFERFFWFFVLFVMANVVWYFAKPIIAPIRYAKLAEKCEIKEKMKQINNANLSLEKKRKINQEFWLCIQSQQGLFEKYFIGVPQALIDQ